MNITDIFTYVIVTVFIARTIERRNGQIFIDYEVWLLSDYRVYDVIRY